jgi:hypothetical protein
MTNSDIIDLYKQNVSESHAAALRAVFNAGWYAALGQTPTATSLDQTRFASKPTALVKAKHGLVSDG